MLTFNVRPTEYHFGLLLSITENCGLGSTESLYKLLAAPENPSLMASEENEPNKKITKEKSFLVDIFDEENFSTTDSKDLIENCESTELTSEWWQNPDDLINGNSSNVKLRPFINGNILKANILYEEKNLVALRTPRSPMERLMLLGGIAGVLKNMQENQVQANSVIFNNFLRVNSRFVRTKTKVFFCFKLIPTKREYENGLIQISNLCGVKLNLQFYNVLLRRRVIGRPKSEISVRF